MDALSASGLRAIRYYLELPHVNLVQANDISESAIGIIRKNLQLNDIKEKIIVSQMDANKVMAEAEGNMQFNVIDLDPFGTAVPFLESALKGVNEESSL